MACTPGQTSYQTTSPESYAPKSNQSIVKINNKLEPLNIRSLAHKAVIVKKMITDNSSDVHHLTGTWLKPNYYIGLNESSPGYCYKHKSSLIVCGGGVATIDIFNVTHRTGFFNSNSNSSSHLKR